MEQVAAAYPARDIHVIWDNLNTPPRPNFLDHQEGVMDGKDL
jgi:hypothetical protein